MSENSARGLKEGPTPAERIRALATGIVTLPKLSERAGEPVRVWIRVVDAIAEYLPIVQDLMTFGMDPGDRAKYLGALDQAGRLELVRSSFEADKALIRLAVLAPRVMEEDAGEANTVPIHALLPDRIFLVMEILKLSGLLGSPSPDPAATVPAEEESAGPEVPEEAFRIGMETRGGDGPTVEPAHVRGHGAAAA